MASKQSVEDLSTPLIKSPSTPARSRLSTQQAVTRSRPRPLLLGSNNPSSRGPGSLRVLRSNSTTLSIESSRRQGIIAHRQRAREIDIGMQVCLPAPAIEYDEDEKDTQFVLIHNLDTPTVSSLSLCMPAVSLDEAEHMGAPNIFEGVDAKMSIKFLVGALKSVDLRLNRAIVDVHLIAKSNGAVTLPETLLSDISDQSNELEFYKIKLKSSNLVSHREQYDMPISRLTLIPNRHTQEEGHLGNREDNPFLMPSSINEALFTVTNPFTRQSMEVVRNPLLDASSRASLQSREALLHSSRINLHGINNTASPYHERHLMNASRMLINMTPQVGALSETASALHELSVGCSQDKTLGSIMDDFTLQRATIERRARNIVHSTVKSRRQGRAISLPQKLSRIPILTDGELSIDDLFSAKDVVESELSNALQNSFIKSIIPEPHENFYTICNWEVSKADSSYDITMDTGYLQHPVFFKTLKSINSIAQKMGLPPERLRQLQLDYLHEYKLHLTAVYNRHSAGIQKVSLSSLTAMDNKQSIITEDKLLQISTQLSILGLLQHAPISLCTHYSRYSLNCIRDELAVSNNFDQFSSTIEACYPLAFKPSSARQSSILRYFKAITALRNCITWGYTYRTATLPTVQNICSSTGQLIRHFFSSEFSMIASMLQRLLLQLKDDISELSNLYSQCIRDCNPDSDVFQARLGNVYPEDRGLLSEIAATYMKNFVHTCTHNCTKALDKLISAADLIINILLRERTDRLLCIKSLLFLYWRSIIPFQLIISAGSCYYRTISYLINLEIQKRYYSDESYNADVRNREDIASRAASRASTRQTTRDLIPTSRLARQISLPNPRPTDSYDEYVDACIKHQYIVIPYLQTLDESSILLGCHNLCIQDVFGLIVRDDYRKVSYNPSRVGLRQKLHIVLSCPLRSLPDTFLAIARHLSAAMYPVLLDFARLFTNTIIASADASDQRHLGERKAIKRLKRGRKSLATKIRCPGKDSLEISSTSSSSDDFKHENEQDVMESDDTDLCLRAQRRCIHTHNNLMFPSAAQIILHRFYHLGFFSSNPSFNDILYRVTLNLTMKFTRHLYCFSLDTNISSTKSLYGYYTQSIQQLQDSVCRLRSHRDDARKQKQKHEEIAIERDNDQLGKNKSLTIDDLYLTAKADNAQLYASLAVLDASYAERLKNIKVPLDYEIRQVIWEMNDASKIFSEEDLKLTKHSIEQCAEPKQPKKTAMLTDDLDCLLENNRLDVSQLSSTHDTYDQVPTMVIYSQPHSLTDVTDPALISDLVSSLLISYMPQVECSLVPLWNLALDLSTIFFTLPIMVSLYFDYFFPVGPNLRIKVENPASPDKNTNALSLSIIDFYSDTPQDDPTSSIDPLSSRPSSTRRSVRSAGKLVATDKQIDALKHFHSMGVFSSSKLEGETVGFIRRWNALAEWSSLSTLLSTQEQLALPKSVAFQDTILAGSGLRELYLDVSPFSLITGTAFENFGYCSFLNITDYNILDCRMINDRFEGIASTARLVVDTVTGELMAGSCYSAIQSSLTSSSMKKLFAYLEKYGRDVKDVSIYNPGTSLYSEFGGLHMWRAPAPTQVSIPVLVSEFIQRQKQDNISSLDYALLSVRSFLDIEEPDISGNLTEYSILHPQIHKIIPQLDFLEIDKMLDNLSLYGSGFHILPTNLYQIVFAISLHEFKKSMTSLLTYYRYLYLYTHYVSLVLVIKTISLELESLEKDLQRPVDGPDSILAQHNLLDRLAKIKLSELYTYAYHISIAQYEGLCSRFQDTRSVFAVNELEDSAFLLLERILCLKEQQCIAAELFKQRLTRFLELTTATEDWMETVSGMLLDHVITISSMVISDGECSEKVSLPSYEEQSALLKKMIIPPVYRSKVIDNLPADNEVDLAFFNSIFNATSLLTLPPPDPDTSLLLQSICSDDTLLKTFVMNDSIIRCQLGQPHLSYQQQQQYNAAADQPYQLSLSHFLSTLYYISTELLSLETVLGKWRGALISVDESFKARAMSDSTPSLDGLHLCLQVFYTISVYPTELSEFLQEARSWGLSMFSQFIPKLYSVLDSTLNAIQALSLWSQPLANATRYFVDMHLDSFTRKNVFLQSYELHRDMQSSSCNGFSIRATSGLVLANIVPSGWQEYSLYIQSSLQRVANDIVCLDLLCTPSFTSFHKKIIQSQLYILDSSLIGDILTAIYNTPCAPEFLAYLCLDAQADSHAIAELKEAERLLSEIVISTIDYACLDPPPEYANQRSHNSHDRDVSKCQIPLVRFLPNNVPTLLLKCESILASVASKPRQCQTKIPVEEMRTLKGVILSKIQMSQCLPLSLLPHTDLLLRTTYSDTVHQRIKDLRNALNTTRFLYHNIIRIPRLFKYALTMYGHASFIEASVISRGVRSMAEHPTLLYSMNVFTMYEATTLFNIYGQYSSLINSKFATGTPLVCYVANVSACKLIGSVSKDLETIVHRIITAPHLSLFSKLSSNGQHQSKTPGLVEHQQHFTPNISLGGRELTQLKHLVPYINGSHHFRGVLFPMWAPASHNLVFNTSDLTMYAQWIRSYVPLNITALIAPFFPNKRRQITELVSSSETLSLAQPVKCPTQLYSFLDTLSEPISSALLKCTSQALKEFSKIVSIMDTLPLQHTYDILSVAYLVSVPPYKSDLAFELHNLINLIVTTINSFVYDALRAAISTTLKTILEQQLKCMTPADFLEKYKHSDPILQRMHLLLYLILFALKMRAGSDDKEQCRDPLILMSNKACRSSLQINHDKTYRDALYIWIIEQYAALLMLEHDLCAELKREQTRDKAAASHLLNAISENKALAHTHAAYLSTNKTFEFTGKHMDEYLHCTIYPVLFLQLIETTDKHQSINITLSNDMITCEASAQWLGAPQEDDLYCVFPPQLYIGIIHVLECLKRKNTVFLLLDKLPQLGRCLLPRAILRRLSRLMLHQTTMMFMSPVTFEKDIIDLMIYLAAGLVVGIIGFEFLETNQQSMMMHILEELRHPTSTIPGLAVVSPISAEARAAIESLEFGGEWSSMTIDDQGNVLGTHVTLRDARVSDVLSQSRGMGKVIIFMHCLLPTEANNVELKAASSTHDNTHGTAVPLVDQFVSSVVVDKKSQSILDSIYSPEIVYYSTYNAHKIIKHGSMSTLSKILNKKWIASLDHSSVLSTVSLQLAQLDAPTISKTDELLILSRSASDSPVCVAFSALHYLLTRILPDNTDIGFLKRMLYLIRATLVTNFVLNQVDANALASVIEAYLSLHANGISDSLFYRYTVQFFYPFFTQHYKDHLSFLMMKYNQSFTFIYTAATISEMLTINTAPILVSSWSYEFVCEVVQLVCNMKALTPIYATDHTELQNLLYCYKNASAGGIIVYQASTVSALQSISIILLNPSIVIPVLVLVPNTLYHKNLREINHVYERQIVVSIVSRCAARDIELLTSPMPSQRCIDDDTTDDSEYLIEETVIDSSCTHPSLLLNPPTHGIDLQTEINLLLSGHDPSCIISFPTLSHITTKWIAARSVYSSTRITRSAIYRVYSLFFQIVFPFCLQGIAELVRREFINIFGNEQELLAVAPTKLLASMIWYNLIEYNLIQYNNCLPNRVSSIIPNDDNISPDTMDAYPFHFTAGSYEACLSGELTTFYKVQNTPAPSKYAYLPDFYKLNFESIPTQSKLFASSVDTIQQLFCGLNTKAFLFCRKTVQSIFCAPANAVLGLVRLLVFIFCATWNAYSLVYLATKVSNIDHPAALSEIYQRLYLSMQRLLTLFCMNQDAAYRGNNSASAGRCTLSGHLLSALRIVALLDAWEKGINTPTETMSYEQRDQHMLLNAYVNKLVNGQRLCLQDSIWNDLGITTPGCLSAFISASSTIRDIFKDIMQAFTTSQNPTLSDVFAYIIPSLGDDEFGFPRISLSYMSYKIGHGFLSALSCASDTQILDGLSLDGVILYELKKASIKQQYKKIQSNNCGKDRPDYKSELLKLRDSIVFSSIAYSYGIGSSCQTSIQRPLSSILCIDEPRAALIVLIAVCAFSAILYPTGLSLEVCGGKCIGKTSLIEIAELLVQNITGPWIRLAGAYSGLEVSDAVRTHPNRLSRWKSTILHIPNAWEHNELNQNQSSSQLSLLSASTLSRQRDPDDNRFTIEEIAIMNTTLIIEKAYDPDPSIQIHKEATNAITIFLPKLTLDHILSLLQLAFSSNRKVCHKIMKQAISFLFSRHQDLFSNYSFLSSLQRYLFWLPSVDYSPVVENEVHAIEEARECHTMHSICAALRDVPEMSNAKLSSIIDGLVSVLNTQVLNLQNLEVLAPLWQIDVSEAYSNLSNREGIKTTVQVQDQDKNKDKDKALLGVIDQSEDSNVTELSQSISTSVKQTGKTKELTIELHNLKLFYRTCSATVIDTSNELCGSIDILLQRLNPDNSNIPSSIESSLRQSNSKQHNLAISMLSNIDSLYKVNPIEILLACGCMCVNSEWIQRFPRYFKLSIMDLYLEHAAYDRQLAEAKIRNISPPENPRYISPSLAIQVFEIYTESKVKREYSTKIAACLRDYLLSPLPCTCFNSNPYTYLRRLFLWSILTSPTRPSRYLISSLCDSSAEYSKRYTDVFARIKGHTISDSLFDDTNEYIIDDLFSLRDDSQPSCSPTLKEKTPTVDKGSPLSSKLRSSIDLGLSDLKDTFNVQSTSARFIPSHDYNHAQLPTSSLLPISLSSSIISIPYYRLYTPFAGHKHFQQVSYLIQALGGYTPFLDIKFEHLYLHTYSDDTTFSTASDRPNSSRTGANTPMCGDLAKDPHYRQHKRILINIDEILAFVSHVSAGEKEKSADKSSWHSAGDFVRSLSIAVLELSVHLQNFDSDFIATLMLLRTAVCLAAGVNPIYFLYTINHTISYSSNQFGLIAPCAQSLLYTPSTRYFDSVASSGFRSTHIYTDEPLLNTHLPSLLSVPGYLEDYIMHTFSKDCNAVSEFTYRFEQGGGAKNLLEQGDILMKKYLIESSYVTILSTADALTNAATGWPTLNCLLGTSINPGNLVRSLFTPEELSIILTSLSINAGLNRHIKPEELHSILASSLKVYVLHGSSAGCMQAIAYDSNANCFGLERISRSPDGLFDGALATFFTALSQSSIRSAKVCFPTIHTIVTNPLFPAPKYTAEQLLIYCKVNWCQLSKIANLPDQLKINWKAHKVAVLLTCLSLHKACSRFSPDWQIPLQSFIKLTVDIISMIFLRAQQYYANINSIASLFKVYTCMTRDSPQDGLKTHDTPYPEIYSAFFNNTGDSTLPIESISLKYLQYFTGNLVSQDSKAFGELCYMRNCLYSCLEICKTYSKLIASILGQVCYEVPILVACMLYGITGLLDHAAAGDTSTNILEIFVKELQHDGLSVTLPGSKDPAGASSSLSKELKLFAIWTKRDLQCNSLFFKHFQISMCLDTPMFMTEIIFRDVFDNNEIYRSLLYAGVLFGLLGRRIFLTYSTLAEPLVFALIASIRRFDTPFCGLYGTLVAASNTPNPIRYLKLKNQTLYAYINQVKLRKVELSVCQPYRHFCAAVAKALAESDRAIIFTDVGAHGVPQNNYSILKKLLVLVSTTRVEARQQITFGNQVTYLFQPLSEYIFVISLAPKYDARSMPVSVLHVIQQTELHRACVLESITFLCNLSHSPKYDSVQVERTAIADMLTGSIFGSEFTEVATVYRRSTMFAKVFLSLTNFVDTFHSYLLEYGAGALPIDSSFRSERTIMTTEAYKQRRAEIEAMISRFLSTYSVESGGPQGTIGDYKKLTCANSSGKNIVSSVSTLLDIIREICLLFYALMPAADNKPPLMDLHTRRSYSIGDEISYFAVSQSINILNELQIGYLLRSRWYVWIEKCAELAWDLLHYLRTLAINDPAILIETNKTTLIAFHKSLCNQLTVFCNNTVRSALKRFFSAHSPLKSTDVTCSIDRLNDSQDCTTLSSPTIVSDLITFRYDSLKYPMLYYVIVHYRILIDFIFQQIVGYVLSRLTSSSAIQHLQAHKLFITLYTLARLGSLEENHCTDEYVISREDLETAILENNIQSLMDMWHDFWQEPTPDINLELLICIYPQSAEEMSSFIYNCLLSSQKPYYPANSSDSSDSYSLDKLIPPQFSISRETKQLFLSCLIVSQLSKGSIDLLPCLTENAGAILVCSQYSCLLVTLLLLYLADTDARTSLKHLLDRNSSIAEERCAALEQHVISLMDAELEKDRKHLNLTYVPLLLQKPTIKGMYLAFILSILLRPESFITASTLLFQALGRYTMSLKTATDQSEPLSILLSNQSVQRTHFPLTLQESGSSTSLTNIFQIDEANVALPQSCIHDSFTSLSRAAHSMIDSSSILFSKRHGLTLAVSNDHTDPLSVCSRHDVHTSPSSTETIEDIIEQCRYHLPMTIVFCEDESLSIDDILIINRSNYNNKTDYPLEKNPVVYQFPLSWTDFHQHSVVCILSNYVCLIDELEYILHLVTMHHQFNIIGVPAHPVWLIIPQYTFKRAVNISGPRLIRVLEHLIYLVRPIIIRHRKPSLPSDLYKIVLTRHFLSKESPVMPSVHQLDSFVVGLLYACVHEIPQAGSRCTSKINQYLDYVSAPQNSLTNMFSATILFIRSLNILLSCYSRDLQYYIINQSKYTMQSIFDYYITIKSLKIKGSIPLLGGRPTLVTRVHRPQPHYRWRKSSVRSTEKDRNTTTSEKVIIDGIYAKELQGDPLSVYNIGRTHCSSNGSHLFNDVMKLMCLDRMIDNTGSLMITLELPSHTSAESFTVSTMLSTFDRILKAVIAKEQDFAMKRPAFSELSEFRHILNRNLKVSKESPLQFLSHQDTSQSSLQIHLEQNNPQPLDQLSTISVHSMKEALIQMLSDFAFSTTKRVWRISPNQGEGDLLDLLLLLRLSLALHKSIPIKGVCFFAFLHNLSGRLYLTDTGALMFANTETCENGIKLSCFPIHVQLTDLILSWGAYDPFLQSFVFAKAEQEQGYTHSISVYIVTVALPTTASLSTLQLPKGHIPIPIQIGCLPVMWLVLPQNESIKIENAPVLHVDNTY